MSNEYDDIINLPHHVSPTRKPMSPESRAAQFAPFAALTGHDEAISETARLTDSMIELSPEDRLKLDRRLQLALSNPTAAIRITYFVEDSTKEGGSYQMVTGRIKKLDKFDGTLYLDNGETISITYIYSIEGQLFNDFLD